MAISNLEPILVRGFRTSHGHRVSMIVTAVFSGMIGVTIFGIFLTPVFYYVIMAFAGKKMVAPVPAIAPDPVVASGHSPKGENASKSENIKTEHPNTKG